MFLVDTHCHLNFEAFSSDLEVVIHNMQTNGIFSALCIAVKLSDCSAIQKITEDYDCIFSSVGVHPEYEDEENPTVDELCEYSNHPKTIAIGETGLDYHRLSGDLEWQRIRFINHIEASKIIQKPLVIHMREAEEDTIHLLRKHKAMSGILHSFTGSYETAMAAIDMGFYISLSGILTFKSASELRKTVSRLPLDRLLIETDSPYLTPAPHRGSRNEPAYVRYVAQCLSQIFSLSLIEIAELTTANAIKLFPSLQNKKATDFNISDRS